MKPVTYKYNADDDAITAWNRNFTSRIGDGTGDPEEAYLSTIRLIARCKPDSVFLDIGCGLGRLIDIVKNITPNIIALEPDKTRFQDCFDHHHDGFKIQVLNIGSSDFILDNPGRRFDFIAVSMVLQHVSTRICDQICSDVFELLAPKGVAIIATTLQDQERFGFQSKSTPQAIEVFDRYAEDSKGQEWGIPVRQFSKLSFFSMLQRAKLNVAEWGQFSYIRPEKLGWMAANCMHTKPEAIANLGTSQFAVVNRGDAA